MLTPQAMAEDVTNVLFYDIFEAYGDWQKPADWYRFVDWIDLVPKGCVLHLQWMYRHGKDGGCCELYNLHRRVERELRQLLEPDPLAEPQVRSVLLEHQLPSSYRMEYCAKFSPLSVCVDLPEPTIPVQIRDNTDCPLTRAMLARAWRGMHYLVHLGPDWRSR